VLLSEVTHAYFDGLNYETNDVGSTESYDIKATKDGQTIKIEVKKTTSDGSDVVLTSNEVELHAGEHPNAATGGELVLEMPWKLEPDRLQPIAYRYHTGL
jgi:Domain of unknown function (DUF3883)